MSTDTRRTDLADRIRINLGCSRDLAADYASAIGDPPEIENGEVLVRDEGGRIVAHLPGKVLASSAGNS